MIRTTITVTIDLHSTAVIDNKSTTTSVPTTTLAHCSGLSGYGNRYQVVVVVVVVVVQDHSQMSADRYVCNVVGHELQGTLCPLRGYAYCKRG